jgi:molybdopterin molybdotransferase
VSFELFVRPAIRTLQGRRDLDRPQVVATLADGVRTPAHKRAFVRVSLARQDKQWVATPTGHQGSHVLSSISAADGLAEIPEDVTEAPAGTRVRVRLLVDN